MHHEHLFSFQYIFSSRWWCEISQSINWLTHFWRGVQRNKRCVKIKLNAHIYGHTTDDLDVVVATSIWCSNVVDWQVSGMEYMALQHILKNDQHWFSGTRYIYIYIIIDQLMIWIVSTCKSINCCNSQQLPTCGLNQFQFLLI